MAMLSFTHGTVGSSKTANLLMEKYMLEHNLKKHVALYKPSVDTRDQEVRSRVGLSASCIRISPEFSFIAAVEGAAEPIDVIMVDEAQFLTREQVEELYELSGRRNLPVKTYGLYTDFRREFFEGSRALVELADEVNKIDSLCTCGQKALANARYVDGVFTTQGDVVGIEFSEANGKQITYAPLCKTCYDREREQERIRLQKGRQRKLQQERDE